MINFKEVFNIYQLGKHSERNPKRAIMMNCVGYERGGVFLVSRNKQPKDNSSRGSTCILLLDTCRSKIEGLDYFNDLQKVVHASFHRNYLCYTLKLNSKGVIKYPTYMVDLRDTKSRMKFSIPSTNYQHVQFLNRPRQHSTQYFLFFRPQNQKISLYSISSPFQPTEVMPIIQSQQNLVWYQWDSEGDILYTLELHQKRAYICRGIKFDPPKKLRQILFTYEISLFNFPILTCHSFQRKKKSAKSSPAPSKSSPSPNTRKPSSRNHWRYGNSFHSDPNMKAQMVRMKGGELCLCIAYRRLIPQKDRRSSLIIKRTDITPSKRKSGGLASPNGSFHDSTSNVHEKLNNCAYETRIVVYAFHKNCKMEVFEPCLYGTLNEHDEQPINPRSIFFGSKRSILIIYCASKFLRLIDVSQTHQPWEIFRHSLSPETRNNRVIPKIDVGLSVILHSGNIERAFCLRTGGVYSYNFASNFIYSHIRDSWNLMNRISYCRTIEDWVDFLHFKFMHYEKNRDHRRSASGKGSKTQGKSFNECMIEMICNHYLRSFKETSQIIHDPGETHKNEIYQIFVEFLLASSYTDMQNIVLGGGGRTRGRTKFAVHPNRGKGKKRDGQRSEVQEFIVLSSKEFRNHNHEYLRILKYQEDEPLPDPQSISQNSLSSPSQNNKLHLPSKNVNFPDDHVLEKITPRVVYSGCKSPRDLKYYVLCRIPHSMIYNDFPPPRVKHAPSNFQAFPMGHLSSPSRSLTTSPMGRPGPGSKGGGKGKKNSSGGGGLLSHVISRIFGNFNFSNDEEDPNKLLKNFEDNTPPVSPILSKNGKGRPRRRMDRQKQKRDEYHIQSKSFFLRSYIAELETVEIDLGAEDLSVVIANYSDQVTKRTEELHDIITRCYGGEDFLWFQVMTQLYLALLEARFPPPKYFVTNFAVLGLQYLGKRSFMEYVRRGVFMITEDVAESMTSDPRKFDDGELAKAYGNIEKNLAQAYGEGQMSQGEMVGQVIGSLGGQDEGGRPIDVKNRLERVCGRSRKISSKSVEFSPVSNFVDAERLRTNSKGHEVHSKVDEGIFSTIKEFGYQEFAEQLERERKRREASERKVSRMYKFSKEESNEVRKVKEEEEVEGEGEEVSGEIFDDDE